MNRDFAFCFVETRFGHYVVRSSLIGNVTRFSNCKHWEIRNFQKQKTAEIEMAATPAGKQ